MQSCNSDINKNSEGGGEMRECREKKQQDLSHASMEKCSCRNSWKGNGEGYIKVEAAYTWCGREIGETQTLRKRRKTSPGEEGVRLRRMFKESRSTQYITGEEKFQLNQ